MMNKTKLANHRLIKMAVPTLFNTANPPAPVTMKRVPLTPRAIPVTKSFSASTKTKRHSVDTLQKCTRQTLKKHIRSWFV
ncbi:hypothetical protein LSAT2_016497 [Lamellibrachia satsuma]|nr:hypothetical protein LSAT2_016497 [Lamellibrachia satsuma]